MRGRIVVADKGGVDEKRGAGPSAGPHGIDQDDMGRGEPPQGTGEILWHGAGLDQPHQGGASGAGLPQGADAGQSGAVVSALRVPDAEDGDPAGAAEIPADERYPGPCHDDRPHRVVRALSPCRALRPAGARGGVPAQEPAWGGTGFGSAALGLITARIKTQSFFRLWRS